MSKFKYLPRDIKKATDLTGETHIKLQLEIAHQLKRIADYLGMDKK